MRLAGVALAPSHPPEEVRPAMRWFGTLAATTAIAAALPLSSARDARASQVFTLEGVSVSAHDAGDGLLVETALVGPIRNALLGGGYGFTLDLHESRTFALFDIWTDEGSVNADDLVPRPISVSLAFSPPPTAGGDPTLGGVTFGSTFFGFVEWGTVLWGAPVVVETSGATYALALSGALFNGGLIDLFPGRGHRATVDLTVTLLSEGSGTVGVLAAPEPSTLALGGIGLAIVALSRLRRRRAA